MKSRKANRLKGYDYSKNNLYFVTSCVKNMECCFGDVVCVGTGRDLSVHNSDKNNSDKNNSDKNNSDKNNSDKNNSDKNNSDKNNSDKNNSDKNNSDKNNSDKNNSDKNNPDKNDEIEAEMILNEYGIIAKNQLEWLEKQYSYISLHSYVVMPNHIHAVIEIDSNLLKADTNLCLPNENVKIKSLSQIMGAYKTTSSKLIHETGNDDFTWHRSFHDHIIRDEKSYFNILNYIENNANTWHKDKFHTS